MWRDKSFRGLKNGYFSLINAKNSFIIFHCFLKISEHEVVHKLTESQHLFSFKSF
jgi:hypothetical protein